MTEPSKSHPELGALLIKAREKVDAMSPDEIEVMLKIQREGVARAAAWAAVIKIQTKRFIEMFCTQAAKEPE